MKRVIIGLALLTLISCASYQAPKPYDFKKTETVQKSFDNTWQKLINFFATKNIPIKNMDKNSGFISTEYDLMVVGTTADEQSEGKFGYCDCGSRGSNMYFKNPTCNFNITLVKKDTLLTEVTANIFFVCKWQYVPMGSSITFVDGSPLQGQSTGVLEKEIFEYLSK